MTKADVPHTNDLGQPIGAAVDPWRPAARPRREVLDGRFCRLEPLDPARHVADLFAAFAADHEGRIWTYLPYGPFADAAALGAWLDVQSRSDDPLFFAIVEAASGRAVGMASYLRIVPEVGVIEVGHLNYAPALQRTAAATEAMALMMGHAFALGYRRYEWKCDALNAPSRRAAERLGFTFEGVFRQATIYKGRNRDTAWYAILDREWPPLAAAYRSWLAGIDAEGRQAEPLGTSIARHRGST